LLVESDNVLIRHFEPEDFEQYCALWDDESVRKNFKVDGDKASKVPENTKSMDMARRLGFSKAADVKSICDPKSVVLVLVREDWSKSAARAQLMA